MKKNIKTIRTLTYYAKCHKNTIITRKYQILYALNDHNHLLRRYNSYETISSVRLLYSNIILNFKL